MKEDDEAFVIVQRASEACLDNLQKKLLAEYPELELKFAGVANGTSIRLNILITKAGSRFDELKAALAEMEDVICYPELHLTLSEIES